MRLHCKYFEIKIRQLNSFDDLVGTLPADDYNGGRGRSPIVLWSLMGMATFSLIVFCWNKYKLSTDDSRIRRLHRD